MPKKQQNGSCSSNVVGKSLSYTPKILTKVEEKPEDTYYSSMNIFKKSHDTSSKRASNAQTPLLVATSAHNSKALLESFKKSHASSGYKSNNYIG